MSSITTSAPAATSALTLAAPPRAEAPTEVAASSGVPSPAPMDPRAPALSPEASAILLHEQNRVAAPEPRSVYETYMPVRAGFTAHALAVGVKQPQAVSSSAGLDDAGVATDARARLDAKYARMQASGKPYGSVPRDLGEDWNSLIGDLDRRSLTSILKNESGLFTKDEQIVAENGLQRQDGLRLGGYNGPAHLAGQFIASGLSFHTPDSARDALMGFDERAAKDKSVASQLGRATMRVLLGEEMSSQLFGGAQVGAEQEMLSLLVDALTNAHDKDDRIFDKLGAIRSVDDLEKADWFAEHRDAYGALAREAGWTIA